METLSTENATPTTNWSNLINEIGHDFAKRSASYDQEDHFVTENYTVLKDRKVFSAAIPEALGGGGMSHQDMCNLLRQMAHYCSSTALALSMHQHLVATNVWKYKKGQGAEETLRKIAEQQLILVSTGAGDWLASNGVMEKTAGGYLVTAQKHFASQAPVGNILVTSAPYKDPENGWQVLHFPVPFHTEGLSVMDNWYTLGMRGTGSHTVELNQVFVPESSILLRRPRGEFHPFWNVVLTAAMPLIMSVYVGIAEKAAEIAVSKAKDKKAPYLPYLLGEMQNELVTAQVMLKDMIRITNNLDFQPVNENGNDILERKTIVANSAIKVVAKAMEIVGGQGYFRSSALEKLFRDIQAGIHHPLQEKAQHYFTGNYMLGNQVWFN